MKKIIALMPVLSLFLISCVTYAPYGQEVGILIPVREPRVERDVSMKRGAFLEIQAKGGGYIKGELIAVEKNSLLVWEFASGTDLSVDIGDIKVIKLSRKSRAYEGALIGGVAGALIGRATYQKPKNTGWIDLDFGPGFNTAAGGLIGMAAGGLVGATAGINQTIQIEGRSESEIKKILEILRSKARFPEYQLD